MLDPMFNQLNNVLYRERLEIAAEERKQRLTWAAAPTPFARLRVTTARQLIALGQWLETPAAHRHAMR